MPDVGRAEMEMLRLYGRVKSFGALPFPGGILQQPAWVMDGLDSVQRAVDAASAKREEEARTLAMKTEMGAKLDGR